MLKIIELFAGIGSQHQALKNIGVEHEVVAVSEIDKYCIRSYEAIHGKVDNLGDICKIDCLPEADLWTYSFPCQDVSVAGKLAGLGKGTRSGLLYEVERLLNIAKERETLPKYLLLENVKNLVSKRFRPFFEEWLRFLEGIGYTNSWKVLNAKDYGIPQNRERVFCVSILGAEAPFSFPEKQELKLKLKDMLEENVEERYYLSQKMLDCFMSDGTGRYPRRERFLQNINRENKEVGNSITTLAGSRPTDNFVVEKFGNKAPDETLEKNDVEEGDFIDAYNRKVKKDGIAGTITTRVSDSNGTFVAEKRLIKEDHCDDLLEKGILKEGDVINHSRHSEKPVSGGGDGCVPTITTRPDELGIVVEGALPIKNLTKKGYLLAEEGDAVDISGRMEYHRGTVQKGISQTITTAGGDNVGVVVKGESMFSETEKKLFTEDGNIKRYIGSDKVDEFKEGQMATTSFPNGYGHGPRTHDESISLNTIDKPCVKCNLRIRKLTSRECLRLMGWSDECIDKIQAAGISSSQQYKQAGNGIVVQVLEAIFRNLFI